MVYLSKQSWEKIIKRCLKDCGDQTYRNTPESEPSEPYERWELSILFDALLQCFSSDLNFIGLCCSFSPRFRDKSWLWSQINHGSSSVYSTDNYDFARCGDIKMPRHQYEIKWLKICLFSARILLFVLKLDNNSASLPLHGYYEPLYASLTLLIALSVFTQLI